MSDTIDPTTTADEAPAQAARPPRPKAAGSAASPPASAATSTSTRSSTESRLPPSHSSAGPASCSTWRPGRDPGRARRRVDRRRGAARPPRSALAPRRSRPARLRRALCALGSALLARHRATSGSRRRSSAERSSGGTCRTRGAAAARSAARCRCHARRATPAPHQPRRRPPRPPARPSLFAPVLGALLAVAGLFGLLAVLDVYDVDVAVALAAGVAIVGVARDRGRGDDATPRRWTRRARADPVGRVRRRRRDAGLGLVGRRREVRAARRRRCSGRLRTRGRQPPARLHRIPAARPGTTSVDASVGVGHLVVTVPDDVALEDRRPLRRRRRSTFSARTDDGVGAHRTVTLPGPSAGRRRSSTSTSTSASATSRCGGVEHDVVPAAAALPRIRRSPSAEACSAASVPGSGRSLRVDPTLVRLTFALLAFAAGAGIVAYGGAGWRSHPRTVPRPRRRRRLLGFVALALAGAIALRGFGFSDSLIWPAALVRRRHPARPGPPVALPSSRPLARRDRRDHLRRPERDGERARRGVRVERRRDRAAARSRPLGLAAAAERDAERTARIRRRSGRDGGRVHDSVLQTLALVQREAGDPRRVVALARRQEREPRSWLYPDARSDGASLAARDRRRGGRGRGAARRPVELVRNGRRAARRRVSRPGAGRARGDGERGWTLRRRRSLDLRRRRRRRDRRLRPRPRQGFDPTSLPNRKHGLAESIRGRMSGPAARQR